MVSPSSFLPEFQADKIASETAPRVVVGAVSPLWLMFGGAAAAGAAYWWWASRWREAVNLEAVLALAPEPVAPAIEAEAELAAAPEPVVEAVALAVETAEAVIDAAVEIAAEAVVETADLAEAANDIVVETVSEAVAEPVPEPAPEPAAEVATAAVDDLTRLVGVGPKLAASLAELGVTRFSQIAAWTADELATVDQQLNLKGRAERDAWIAQAKRFAAGVEAN